MEQKQDTDSKTIVNGINYCFSQRVDERSLKIIQDMLQGMRLANSDINTVMVLFAAICEKHYKYGYTAAQKIRR